MRARDLAREALTAAGYHHHKRGEWRKRRVSGCCLRRTRGPHDGFMGGRNAHPMGGG
jgi:hypothetical protein